jgi:RNA polymerase sigma-70 factor (ECF subfamily)
VDEKEIAISVQRAISELPSQCRLIFTMNKYSNLTYSEIAEIQNISIKTLETHMGRALKFLRKRLANLRYVFIKFMIYCLFISNFLSGYLHPQGYYI